MIIMLFMYMQQVPDVPGVYEAHYYYSDAKSSYTTTASTG